MAKQKKQNPSAARKSLPADEQVRIARRVTMEATTAVIFSALTDGEEQFDKERLLRLWGRVNKLSIEIAEGRVNWKDLAKALKEEYGIKI